MEQPVERAAFVTETVEKAMAPFAALLPADLAAEMRAFLEDVLTTHPVGSTLLERARPRAVPERSGDVSKDGVGNEDAVRRRGGAG